MAGHGHSVPPNWGGTSSENNVKRATERMEPGSPYNPNKSPAEVDVYDDYFWSDDLANFYIPWQPPQIRQRSSTAAPQTYQTIRQTNPELDPYDPLELMTVELPPGSSTRHLERRRSFVRAREERLDIREPQNVSAEYHQAVVSRPNNFYYESPSGPHSYEYHYHSGRPSTQGRRSRSRERRPGLEHSSEYNRINNSDEDSFGYRTGIKKSTRDRSDARATRSISSGRLGHRSRSRSRSRSRRRDNRRASYKYGPPPDGTLSGMQLASYEESTSRKEGVSKSLPDDSKPVKEEVSLAKKGQAQGIPSGARWTKINRRLVSPAALEAGKERFEERSDHVIVLRVLSKEEIEEYALRTRDLRDARKLNHRRESTSGRVQPRPRVKDYAGDDGSNARDESFFAVEPLFERPPRELVPSLSSGPSLDISTRQGMDNSRVPINQFLRRRDYVKDGEKEGTALNEPTKPSTPNMKSYSPTFRMNSIGPYSTLSSSEPLSSPRESPSSSDRSEETDISSPDLEDDSIDSGISSVKDMSHLLDSSRYFSELDNLEVRTAEILGLKGSPNLILKTMDDCLVFCKSWQKAFVNLTSEGFCGSQVTFLVEDSERNDIADASHVSLIQINYFIEVFEGFFKSLDERRITKVTTKFLRSILHLQDDNSASIDLIASLRILCRTLAIGLLSFTGSHVCRFNLNLWDREINEISIGYEGYAFKPRKLACLEDFIGGPAWTLSKARMPPRTHEQLGESQGKELAQGMQSLAIPESPALDNEQSAQREQGMKISITLQDLQELWGPAFLVGGTEDQAPVIRTERGFIVPLPQQPESSKHGIECHWTSEIPDLLLGENSDNPIMLQSTSKILIGTPSENDIGFVVNKKCKSSIPLIQQQIASRLLYPGTSKPRYVSDGFDIQLGAGQYATAGLVKKYKRLPKRTLKAMLIEDCPKPDTKLVPLLNLWVGLEVSACTGNAQRVKLWDALRLSQADVQSKENTSGCTHAVGSKECIASCWTKWQSDDEIDSLDDIPDEKKHLTGAEARRIIIHSILALEHSGVDSDGNLQVCWPFSHSPASCPILPSSPRELHHWFRVVKDSRDTSSFAVFSQRCLEFPDQSFCVPCKERHVNSPRQTILATRILGFAEQRPFSGLLQGVKFVVGEAHLTVTKVLRNHAAVIAAISVNPLSPLRYRLREMLPATGSDSGASGFKEHIRPDITTDLSVPVFAY